jgi:hypothetical protein
MKTAHPRHAQDFTRRDFLKGSAYVTLGMALGVRGFDGVAGAAPSAASFAAVNPTSRVVLVRDSAAVSGDHEINAQVVARMVDSGLKALADEAGVADFWSTLLQPADTVGIKFSRCQWHGVPTEQATIDAVLKGVSSVGVPEGRIHAADYGLPAEQCTALINVTSIKGHIQTGIAASLKNYINFTDSPSKYHVEGSINLGEAWHLPQIKGKTRLIVVDALRPHFGPGPRPNPVHRWAYKGIIVGTDPVAVDTVCARLCQQKRNRFKKEPWPISPPPISIAAADTQFGLGESDPSKIKLIRLGWKEDVLI